MSLVQDVYVLWLLNILIFKSFADGNCASLLSDEAEQQVHQDR